MNTKSRDYFTDYYIKDGELKVILGTNEQTSLSLSDLEDVKNKIREELKDLKKEEITLKNNYKKYKLYAALSILISVLTLGSGTIISFASAAVAKALAIVLTSSGGIALFKKSYDKTKEIKTKLEDDEINKKIFRLNKVLNKKEPIKMENKKVNYQKTYDETIDKTKTNEDKGISFVKKSA